MQWLGEFAWNEIALEPFLLVRKVQDEGNVKEIKLVNWVSQVNCRKDGPRRRVSGPRSARLQAAAAELWTVVGPDLTLCWVGADDDQINI